MCVPRRCRISRCRLVGVFSSVLATKMSGATTRSCASDVAPSAAAAARAATLHANVSTMRERILSFTPIETVPLPRPLNRFGTAFPIALADVYATAYAPRRGVVLDPLAHPWSAADAVDASDRRGIATSREPLGEWARAVVALAPPGEDVVAAFERVADSALVGTPHRVAMRELYGSHCATCHGPVVVEAFLWERDAPVPTKKAFRCGVCAREGRALLIEPVDADDEERTRRLEPRGMAYWQFVERFGADPAAQALGETVAALYTPRNITALMATLRAIETSVGDAAAQGLLKLCLLESIVAGSRLNAVAGHGTPLRIDKGRARRGPRPLPGAGGGRPRRLEHGRKRAAARREDAASDGHRRGPARGARAAAPHAARRAHRGASRLASRSRGGRVRAAGRRRDD